MSETTNGLPRAQVAAPRQGRGALSAEYPKTPAGVQALEEAIKEAGGPDALGAIYGVTKDAVIKFRQRLRKSVNGASQPAERVDLPASDAIVDVVAVIAQTGVAASETSAAPDVLTPAPGFEGLSPKEQAPLATCRVALDSEDVEGGEVLAWLEPDEADPAFVSWKRASGALPTQVAIELAGTPAELVAWMVPFIEEEEEEELDAETEAGIAALRADLAQATGPEAERHAEEAACHPAVRFLKALGKDPADTWFRTFVPRGKANRRRSGRDLHGFDVAGLEADNREGQAVYFITGDANQATGKNNEGKPTGCVCDDDITHCRAVFVEWDGPPIE